MLGAPLQCSAFLTRHAGLLEDCNATHAEYLYQPDKLHTECDLGDKVSRECFLLGLPSLILGTR